MKHFNFVSKGLNLFLIIISIFLFSCKDNSSKSTEVVAKFENGKPRIVREYKNDSKTKYREIQYYSNGQKQFEGDFEDGKKRGLLGSVA